MNITTEQAFNSLHTGKESITLMLEGSPINSFSEFGSVSVRIAFVKNTSTKFNNSLGFYDNSYGDKHKYKHLQLIASMDSSSSSPYGQKLNFAMGNERAVDLNDLEDMTKAIRPILRKLKVIAEHEGYTESFEEMVIRLGRVLKVQSFYVIQDGGTEWERNENMSELRSAIQDKVKTTAKAIGYKENDAA
jgi:hypothetical protein